MVNNFLYQFSKTYSSNTHIDDVQIGAGMTVDQTNDALQHLSAVLAYQVGVLNNKSADIASASTTNLAGATGDRVDITGTNTIASFGTLPGGQKFWLRFTGAGLTITHHATQMIMPNAGNLLIQQNDVLLVESLGSGNWRYVALFPFSGSSLPSGTGPIPWAGAGIEHLTRPCVGAIDLVDHEHGDQPAFERLAEHEARLRERALRGVDQQHDAVDHFQRPLYLAAESVCPGCRRY